MNDLIMWSPGVTLEAVEKQVIQKAYSFYRGNKTATANALGIAIRTLDSKLEKYADDVTEQGKKDEERREQQRDFLARSRGITTDNADGSTAAQAIERQRSHGAAAGVRMESVANASAQPAVPVSKQEKVQVVLPAQTPNGGARRNR